MQTTDAIRIKATTQEDLYTVAELLNSLLPNVEEVGNGSAAIPFVGTYLYVASLVESAVVVDSVFVVVVWISVVDEEAILYADLVSDEVLLLDDDEVDSKTTSAALTAGVTKSWAVESLLDD